MTDTTIALLEHYDPAEKLFASGFVHQIVGEIEVPGEGAVDVILVRNDGAVGYTMVETENIVNGPAKVGDRMEVYERSNGNLRAWVMR